MGRRGSAALERVTSPTGAPAREHVPLGETGSEEPFDAAALRRRIGDDPRVFAKLAVIFASESVRLLEELKSELERGDGARAQQVAHELKGMLLNLGAAGAAALARRIESLSAASQCHVAREPMDRLRSEMQRLGAALSANRPKSAP